MKHIVRISTILIAIAGLVAVSMSPAAGAIPETFTVGVTFPDANACTGEVEMVSITWTITVHDDGMGAEVLTLKSLVETSSGWSGGGTETQVATGNNVLINNVNIRLSNGDGGIIMVKGLRKIDLNTGEVVVGTHRSTCVRQ